MNHLGEKIKEIRLKEGLSQEAFAKELGYNSRSTINKIEKGVNEISYDKLMLLVKKYKIPVNELFDSNDNEEFEPLTNDSVLYVSFSARDNGNSIDIAHYLKTENDRLILFKNIFYHPCAKCNYECFDSVCKYRHDDIYNLLHCMMKYKKVVFIVPMYCGHPSSLYFIFNERSQDYFMHNEDKYENILKRLFIIGIYGSNEESPDFIPCLEKWFSGSKYSNHVLGIERHKYGFKLNDSILNVEEIRNSIDEFINPSNAKIEESAMAVVMCKGKILTTTEMVYGQEKVSLPKGHVEKNETSLEASIRECYEETNIVIHESNLVKNLTAYHYEFLTPSNQLIRKTISPYLFEVNDFGNPLSKEERILSVQWMNMKEFLSLCSYDNVKNILNEVLNNFYQLTSL